MEADTREEQVLEARSGSGYLHLPLPCPSHQTHTAGCPATLEKGSNLKQTYDNSNFLGIDSTMGGRRGCCKFSVRLDLGKYGIFFAVLLKTRFVPTHPR